MANPTPTNPYLQPWSVVPDARIALYEHLHRQVAVLLEKGASVNDLDVVGICLTLDRLGPVPK